MLPTPEAPHLVIRASAGSGKTYRLTLAYLNVIAAVSVAADDYLASRGLPSTGGLSDAAGESKGSDTARREAEQAVADAASRILATTFTRKAAGEILQRVLTRLADAANNNAAAARLAEELGQPTLSPDACRAMLGRLGRRLHRLSIGTLDSFFNRVALSFRHELGIVPGAAVTSDDDPRIAQLRREAILAVLGEDELPTMLELLRRLHHDQSIRGVGDAIDEIVRGLYDTYRAAPQRDVWDQLLVPAGWLDREALEDAKEALRSVDLGTTDKRFAKAHAQHREVMDAEDWAGFSVQGGLVKGIVDGDCRYYKKEIDASVVEAYLPIIRHARAAVLSAQREQTLATHDLLRRFDQHFTRLREAHGLLLYSDFPHKLASMLPDREQLRDELYYRLDGRIDHLFLDEHQDTSLQQWRVLQPLATEVASKGQDGEGSLFVVGDVKQAIYGWRGGCAEVFDLIDRDLPLGDDAFQAMDDSWRSSQVVLDACNRLFATIGVNPAIKEDDRGAAIAWQQHYHAHTAARDLPGYVTLSTSEGQANDDAPFGDENTGDGNAGDEDGHVAVIEDPHLDSVAAEVEQIIEQSPGRSIGVLCRRNATVNALLRRLHDRGVRASGESGDLLTDHPAVVVVLAALVMADHPGNTAAAFRVFHSPLGEHVGLDKDLSASRREAGARAIRTRLLEHGYAALISAWADVLAPFVDRQGVSRLEQLIELAYGYDPSLTLRTSDFIEHVKATPVEAARRAIVRVMTVHKSKGLEFDAVVLPELHARLGDVRTAHYAVRDSPVGPIIAVHRYAKKEVRRLSPQLEAAHAAARARRFTDDLCSLYVAMTRARYALHMIVPPRKLTKTGKVSEKYAFDIALRAAFDVADETPEQEQTLFEQGDADWHAQLLMAEASAEEAQLAAPINVPDASDGITPRVRLKPRKGPPRRSWQSLAPSQAGDATLQAGELLQWRSNEGQRYGSLLHGFFETVAWSDDLLNDAGEVDPEELNALIDAAIPATSEGTADAGASRVKQARQHVSRLFADPLVVDALRKPVVGEAETVELWRERSFAQLIDGKLVSGQFDRVIIIRCDGVPTRASLLDYKSDTLPDRDDAGFEAALTSRVKHHRPQMLTYRQALAAMLGLDTDAIKTQLLFVSAGVAAEL